MVYLLRKKFLSSKGSRYSFTLSKNCSVWSCWKKQRKQPGFRMQRMQKMSQDYNTTYTYNIYTLSVVLFLRGVITNWNIAEVSTTRLDKHTPTGPIQPALFSCLHRAFLWVFKFEFLMPLKRSHTLSRSLLIPKNVLISKLHGSFCVTWPTVCLWPFNLC